MLDSGCTVTAVVPWVLAALKARPGQPAQSQTATGKLNAAFYEISFSIYQVGSAAILSRQDWQVMNLGEDLTDVDILFGLDLLREIVLTVHGPSSIFTLDF
jgi:hypothetical protein